MALWDAGKIEGLTVGMLQRVCAHASADHRYSYDCDCADERRAGIEHESWCRSLTPEAQRIPVPFDSAEIGINEVSPPTDRAFDRVRHARHSGETFWRYGAQWKVRDFHGRPWTVECVTGHDAVTGGYDVGETVSDWKEEDIAAQLNSARPHPNPYIALVELTYNDRGNRAGYGIRADGSCELFYN